MIDVSTQPLQQKLILRIAELVWQATESVSGFGIHPTLPLCDISNGRQQQNRQTTIISLAH